MTTFTSSEAMAQQFQKTVLNLKTQSDYVESLWRLKEPGNPSAAMLHEGEFEERVVELFHAKAQAVKFLSAHYDEWKRWSDSVLSQKPLPTSNAQAIQSCRMALFSLLEDKHLTFNANEKDIVSRFTQTRKAHRTQPFLKEDVEIFSLDLTHKNMRDSLYKKITQDFGEAGREHRAKHEAVLHSAFKTENNRAQYQSLIDTLSQRVGVQYDEVWQSFKQRAKKGELQIEYGENEQLVCSFTIAPTGEKRFPMPTAQTYTFTCTPEQVVFQPFTPNLAQKIEGTRAEYMTPALTAKNLTL